MSETKSEKFHTAEFKAKVGLEAMRGAKTVNEIGQEYGVHPVTVGQWKKEMQEQAKTYLKASAVLSQLPPRSRNGCTPRSAG